MPLIGMPVLLGPHSVGLGESLGKVFDGDGLFYGYWGGFDWF